MSAKGLFLVGFSVKEVRAIQSKAKALLLEGKTLMSWSDSGTSTSKQFAMPVADVLEECAYALRRLAPEKFGKNNKLSAPTSYVPPRLFR